jgi:hypothetical protein
MTKNIDNDFKIQIQSVVDTMATEDPYRIYLMDKFISEHPDGTIIANNDDDQSFNISFLFVSDKNCLKLSDKGNHYVFDSEKHGKSRPRTLEFISITFPTDKKYGLCDFSEINVPEYKNDTFELLINAKHKGYSNFSVLRPVIEYDIRNAEDRDMPYDGDIDYITIETLDSQVDKGYATELCRVKFNDKLVMFIAKPSRSDIGNSAIVDEKEYRAMISYLDKLFPVFPFEVKTVKMDDIAFDFTNFGDMSVVLES